MKTFYQDLNKILEWDVLTWSKGLSFWNYKIKEKNFKTVLEIGCGKGGICYFFIHYSNFKKITGSDLNSNFQDIYNLKKNQKFTYKKIDALNTNFPDKHFDVVCFKSVLGGIARENQNLKLELVMKEINRVLKENGELLFMENLKGSLIHAQIRKMFRPWGKSWNYISFSELNNYFKVFKQHEIKTFGFFSAFAPNNTLIKKIFYLIDHLFIFKNLNYMCYGYAKKKN